MRDISWHLEGHCSGHPDPDLWHYSNSGWDDEQELEALRSVQAIELCQGCPVKDRCLAQGMELENIYCGMGGDGSIWGGYMTSERARMAGLGLEHNSIRMEKRHARRVRQLLGKLVR